MPYACVNHSRHGSKYFEQRKIYSADAIKMYTNMSSIRATYDDGERYRCTFRSVTSPRCKTVYENCSQLNYSKFILN